ncbi:type VI secretion system ImpA family N-terminal domain-containing protein [Pseudomonas aeruginosa]|nr:type VI secretion system ImpA family N-terminal domain-containing protein [Pseudomonas aeruginosa]
MSLVSTPTPLELDVLLAPFDPRQPAGVFDEEEESFQAIELEMVKLGGLHASSIDWAYVDTASRQYLVKNAKHFRVAGHLVVTRLRSQTWSAWAGAAGLLAGMVERFWETGYPKPGTLGLPAKRKLLALQLERLGEALAGLAPASFAAQWADVAGAGAGQTSCPCRGHEAGPSANFAAASQALATCLGNAGPSSGQRRSRGDQGGASGHQRRVLRLGGRCAE